MSHLLLLLVACFVVLPISAGSLSFDSVVVSGYESFSADARVSTTVSLPDTDNFDSIENALNRLASDLYRRSGLSESELNIVLNQNVNQNINVNQNVNVNQNIITINLLFGGELGPSQASGPVVPAGLTGVEVGVGSGTTTVPLTVGSSGQFLSFGATAQNMVGVTASSSARVTYQPDVASVPEPTPVSLVLPTLVAMMAFYRRLRVR